MSDENRDGVVSFGFSYRRETCAIKVDPVVIGEVRILPGYIHWRGTISDVSAHLLFQLLGRTQLPLVIWFFTAPVSRIITGRDGSIHRVPTSRQFLARR
jgi:hypothetical protein